MGVARGQEVQCVGRNKSNATGWVWSVEEAAARMRCMALQAALQGCRGVRQALCLGLAIADGGPQTRFGRCVCHK